jgi:hypothetical protein
MKVMEIDVALALRYQLKHGINSSQAAISSGFNGKK